jgi:hypothetical protein
MLDPDNPLGIKGANENGTLGVQQVTQHMTPEKIGTHFRR